AMVDITYNELDAQGAALPSRFVRGRFSNNLEVRIDKDLQPKAAAGDPDVFWYHVFVSNLTNPFTKLQLNVDVYMAGTPGTPEKGEMEGKDTVAEALAKGAAEKVTKDT